jgi:GNAT superfamily N-acetyltransferase
MEISLRKAEEADVAEVLRLVGQLDDGHASGPRLNAAEATRILRRMATYPNYAVYVAEAAGQLVGTFALLIMDNLAHGGAPSAVVEDVCVDAGARGRGIGRAMMSFAMGLAREGGCYKLVLSSNRARTRTHAFYRSLGFAEHGLSFHVELTAPGAASS